jgi:hypothetical protein
MSPYFGLLKIIIIIILWLYLGEEGVFQTSIFSSMPTFEKDIIIMLGAS